MPWFATRKLSTRPSAGGSYPVPSGAGPAPVSRGSSEGDRRRLRGWALLGPPVLLLFFLVAAWRAPDGAQREAPWSPDGVPWAQVGRLAAEVVAAESPPEVWPFEHPEPALLAASPRKVILHYFPAWTVSLDNLPAASDHWALHYMRRSGEGGIFRDAGGFVRQRPLQLGPWQGPYWREINAAVEVLRAQLIGADGFGVGIQQLGSGRYFDVAFMLCHAAAHVAPGFLVLPEPDGDVLSQATPEQMAHTLARFETCPASWHVPDGRYLIAPFSPQLQSPSYWQEVIDRLEARGVATAFVPILLSPKTYADRFAPMSYGMTYWGWRDPAMASDPASLAMLDYWASLTPNWIQPVSPQDARPKKTFFWEAANTELFRRLWMQAIERPAAFVHVVSWNAYPEASEIAPSSGTQFLFYDLAAYYISWFKTGHAPAIDEDAIYYSHRTQIFSPERPPRSSDKPFRRLGKTTLLNDVELLAMLTEPATLEIEIGARRYVRNAAAGVATLRAPAEPGRPVFRIVRDGRVIVEEVSDWAIEDRPSVLNPVYFGGSSTRPFVAVPDAAEE